MQLRPGILVLDYPVGRGGMADVWRATHVPTDDVVAVKVLRGERVRSPRFQEAFRNEVRIAARLDHPHLVRVLDHGHVDSRLASESAGRLEPGAPWLAMEWAQGGSLARRLPCASWEELRSWLVALLRALAHAHARDVLHLDVKPGNTLVAADGLKLADFGIARLRELGPQDLLQAGTPAFMAPEQARGQWRDQGPWTDLYSVGCLAWALCTGRAPFAGTHREVTSAHLRVPLPPLQPAFPVPLGFAEWIVDMTAKRRWDRYQLAPDALRGLADLGPPVALSEDAPSPTTPVTADTWVPPGEAGEERPTLVATSATTATGSAITGEAASEEPADDEARVRLPPVAASPPPTWREPPIRGRPSLEGLGLALHPVRRTPLVGRYEARDRLWAALRDVHARHRLTTVLLRGAAGVGKSRLTSWLSERANEVGAAHTLRARHGPLGGPQDGLVPAIREALGCNDLEPGALRRRLARILSHPGPVVDAELDALVDLIAPPATDARRLGLSRVERHAAVEGALRHLSARRPVLLTLDAAHWGPDALRFAFHLIERDEVEALPVLVVVNVDDDALETLPTSASLVQALADRPETLYLELEPLDADERLSLFVDHLGLSEDLAARLDADTGGSPAFALNLVRHLVAEGEVVPTATGLVWTGSRPEIHDAASLWRLRLGRVLKDADDNDVLGLEVAACLGPGVDAHEWERGCKAAGVVCSFAIVERLVAGGLAMADPRGMRVGWAFAEIGVRQAMLDRATNAGRLQAHHAALADVVTDASPRSPLDTLAGLPLENRPSDPGREALHRLAAGQIERAAGRLREAAERSLQLGDLAPAAAWIRLHGEAMRVAGIPPDDRRQLEGNLIEGSLAETVRDVPRATRLARDVHDRALAMGYDDLRARALHRLGRASRLAGRADEAEHHLDEALQLARALGLDDLEATTLSSLGRAHQFRGAVDAAIACYEQALDVVRRRPDSTGEADCTLFLAECRFVRGELEASETSFHRAYELARRVGYRTALSHCANGLGEIARHRGDLALAERHYREGIAWAGITGDSDLMMRANLGTTLLEAGRTSEARGQLEAALRRAERTTATPLAGALQAILLECEARDAAWDTFDQRVALASEIVGATGVVEVDIARSAERAGEVALAAGQPTRARAAWDLALIVWRRAGRSGEANALERRAAVVEDPTA